MAVLYDDQYKAMEKLGADETFVLGQTAYGYNDEQIGIDLAKRKSRDTNEKVDDLLKGVYHKLGVFKEPKESERRRLSGKMYLDFKEMKTEHQKPRPRSGPYVPPVDFEDTERRERQDKRQRPEPRIGIVDIAFDTEKSPDAVRRAGNGAVGRTLLDAAAPPEENALAVVKRIGNLGRPYLNLLKALSENPDPEAIRTATGLAENSIKSYTSQIYSVLGITGGKSAGDQLGKRKLAIAAYQAWVTTNGGDAAGAPPTAKPSAAVPKASEEPPGDPEETPIPSDSSVVTLERPDSVVEVEVSEDSLTAVQRAAGFRLEHIVIPSTNGESPKPLYIIVKRA